MCFVLSKKKASLRFELRIMLFDVVPCCVGGREKLGTIQKHHLLEQWWEGDPQWTDEPTEGHHGDCSSLPRAISTQFPLKKLLTTLLCTPDGSTAKLAPCRRHESDQGDETALGLHGQQKTVLYSSTLVSGDAQNPYKNKKCDATREDGPELSILKIFFWFSAFCSKQKCL